MKMQSVSIKKDGCKLVYVIILNYVRQVANRTMDHNEPTQYTTFLDKLWKPQKPLNGFAGELYLQITLQEDPGENNRYSRNQLGQYHRYHFYSRYNRKRLTLSTSSIGELRDLLILLVPLDLLLNVGTGKCNRDIKSGESMSNNSYYTNNPPSVVISKHPTRRRT